MMYPAVITREGSNALAEFPDCPGCQTFSEPGEEIRDQAQDALEGWLRAHLLDGEAPPRPSARTRCPKGARLMQVEVSPKLAVRIAIRWARQDAGLTQAQLAERAGVSQPQIAKLERPRANPTIDTLEKVARALGMRLDVELTAV